MNKTLTALLLGGAMIFSVSVQALAAEPTPSQDSLSGSSASQPQSLPHSLLYYGTVSEIVYDDQSGEVTRLNMASEAHGAMDMILSPSTLWIDSGAGTASDPDTLKTGEGIYVFHSPVSTMSLPPQTSAYVIVRNVPQDTGCAMYHVVEKVSRQEDGSLALTTDNGGLILYPEADTQLVSYDGSSAQWEELKEDCRVMAWYSAVLESYPAQAFPSRPMILPQESQEFLLPQGTRLTMELDGKVPNMVGRYESGTAMVPVAAVAQALGFQVTYTPDPDEGALVTVESDTFRVSLYIDQNLIFGSTKMEGAVGMTGPQNYGKAAYIVDPGTTWAPAQLFEMLGKTVTLEGTNLVIE